MLEENCYRSSASCKDPINSDHYFSNSMRGKPSDPVALIEQNRPQLRVFPHINNYVQSGNEWRYFRDDRQFKKRCNFNYDSDNLNIHLASLDTISTQHLRDPVLKLPHEDEVFQKIGQKRNNIEQRNGLISYSKGDKTYKAVEYSQGFHSKKHRNWRTEYFGITKRAEEPLPDELIDLLSSNQRNAFSSLFSNKFDYGYENDTKRDREDEIDCVKSLGCWKTSVPLPKPFKVLDITDKSQRYRPKITR